MGRHSIDGPPEHITDIISGACDQIDAHVLDADRHTFGHNTPQLVRAALLATHVLRPLPNCFDKAQWARAAGFHPETFMPLTDNQVDVVLRLGAAIGLLIEPSPGTFAISDERVRMGMEELYLTASTHALQRANGVPRASRVDT